MPKTASEVARKWFEAVILACHQLMKTLRVDPFLGEFCYPGKHTVTKACKVGQINMEVYPCKNSSDTVSPVSTLPQN